MKKPLLFLLLFCFGCTADTSNMHIKLKLTDSGLLKLTGLDIAIVNDINRDTAKNKWQVLFPVYHMPVGTDFNNYDVPQPGIYTVSGSDVLFKPDTPFVKGQTYFARFYRYDKGLNLWDMITNKTKPGEHLYEDKQFMP